MAMKKLLIAVLGVGFWLGHAAADDCEKHADAGLVFLSLSDKQVEEIEKSRTFTLSKEQLAELRSTAPTFPKKLGVASPFVDRISDSKFSIWPDHVSGTWCCRDQVAIASSCLEGSVAYRGFNKTLGAGDAVLIDTAGGYWVGSRRMDLGKLVKRLDFLETRQHTGISFSVFILRPPVLEPEQEAAVQEAVATLKSLCDERGFTPRLGG
jgi:hypothetical protein